MKSADITRRILETMDVTGMSVIEGRTPDTLEVRADDGTSFRIIVQQKGPLQDRIEQRKAELSIRRLSARMLNGLFEGPTDLLPNARVFWSERGNSYVIEAAKDEPIHFGRTWYTENGTTVKLWCINGIGEIRWDVGHSMGTAGDADAVRYFRLTRAE